MQDLDPKVEDILWKVYHQTEASKINWSPSSQGVFEATVGLYKLRSQSDVFEIFESGGHLLGSISEDPSFTFGVARPPVSDLWNLARRLALNVDKKLDDLSKLLS